MKILNIPIEPLEERYSIQWDNWFAQGFKNEPSLEVLTVYGGKTSGKINVGSFLDVVETNVYKLDQLAIILNILSTYNNSYKLVLFFHDLWFPGLETIAYIRAGKGLSNLKICGCLHAGSYDEHDFLNKVGMTPWAKHMEYGWFEEIVDQIYVATHFHKRLLYGKRGISTDKIIVTGFPLYEDYLPQLAEKENIIVFPHRLDEEKQPDLFLEMKQELQHVLPDWEWIRTKDVVENKQQYYKILSRAKIALSFAKQETWGIAMQEAVLCGCIPVCPRRLSYQEMYPLVFLYDSFEEAKSKVVTFASSFSAERVHPIRLFISYRGKEAIPNIINQIKQL